MSKLRRNQSVAGVFCLIDFRPLRVIPKRSVDNVTVISQIRGVLVGTHEALPGPKREETHVTAAGHLLGLARPHAQVQLWNGSVHTFVC